MPKVYSFDVYDTVIARSFMRPMDVFHAVAHSFRNTSASYTWTPDKFVTARVRAMRAARRTNASREECRLEDAISNFVELKHWGIEPQRVIEAELSIEREVSFPISETITLIRDLENAGKRIVFISDMYLPGDFIWALLCKMGIQCKRGSVYVSSDIGVTKRSGKLFQHVIKSEKIEPGEMEHLGDNKIADVKVPRRLGINARLFMINRPNRYERRIDKRNSDDHIQRSALAGFSKAMRYRSNANSNGSTEAAISRVASNIIGPFLMAYVSWVLHDATERRIKRLYFLARDGQLLWKIANTLLSNSRMDIECKYIYGSRRAWRLSSVTACTHDQLKWSYGPFKCTILDVLRRLEVDTLPVRNALSRSKFTEELLGANLNTATFEEFKTLLTQEPISTHILRRAAELRELVVAYFRQEGLLERTPWALVDVGWILSNQRTLRSILVSNGYAGDVRGYYLGVPNGHVPLAEVGECRPFVTQGGSDLRSPLSANWFFNPNTHAVIEYLFTRADHPTTIGYSMINGQVVPSFKSELSDSSAWGVVNELHKAVLHYVHRAVQSPHLTPTSTLFRSEAFASVRDFALNPEHNDVRGLAELQIFDGPPYDPGRLMMLACPLTSRDLLDLFYIWLGKKTSKSIAPSFAWWAGSAAISNPLIHCLYRCLHNDKPFGLKPEIIAQL